MFKYKKIHSKAFFLFGRSFKFLLISVLSLIIYFFFLLLPLSLILFLSLPFSSSFLPFLSISLSCSIALNVTLVLLTSLSISLNISKEWITLGCHLALAKNSFLWVKCFKLSSLTGTISYNNYMDGPWLGVPSSPPHLPPSSSSLHIHAKKISAIVGTKRGRDGERLER